jgi:hypothetical protein
LRLFPRPAVSFARLCRGDTVIALLGVAVLAWWGTWWAKNLQQTHLQKSPAAWFQPYPYIGLDFLHNYYAARHWVGGGDPYHEPFGDPLGRKLCYPPIVLPFFAWCQLYSPRTAVRVWTLALAGFAAAGTVAACRSRRELGLAPVPLPFALAAVLTSAPLIYAMERGNYDLLVLPPVLLAAWALRKRTVGRDALAGAGLALAACFKVYPGLLVLGLLPLRRGRAFLFALAAGAAFASFQAGNLPVFVENLKALVDSHDPDVWGRRFVLPLNHSITLNWELLWEGTKLAPLAKVPGPVAAAAVVGGLFVWVAFRIYHCPDPRPLALPFFLWAAAAATFVPKVANDYSLFFLPIAALAVWDRRDSMAVHVGLASMALWAEPIAFGISPSVSFAVKVVALVLTAACLASRAKEQEKAHPLPRVGFDPAFPGGP